MKWVTLLKDIKEKVKNDRPAQPVSLAVKWKNPIDLARGFLIGMNKGGNTLLWTHSLTFFPFYFLPKLIPFSTLIITLSSNSSLQRDFLFIMSSIWFNSILCFVIMFWGCAIVWSGFCNLWQIWNLYSCCFILLALLILLPLVSLTRAFEMLLLMKSWVQKIIMPLDLVPSLSLILSLIVKWTFDCA